MRLDSLKRNWERLARRDPYFAVLTDIDGRPSGRDVNEFFRTGRDEITAVLQRAARLGLAVPRRRALDFGCGVGRLTQALAVEFERCDGVDISSRMLQIARQHARNLDRCHFHLNVSPDLARFDHATFSFAYSTLVLQHMEPQHSVRYIRELIRVLAPDGLLVFQLPSGRVTEPMIERAAGTPVSGRLPPEAFRARLTSDTSMFDARANDALTLTVTVENRSPQLWPSLPDARGRYQVNLANRWLSDAGDLLQRDDLRFPLPHDLAPAARADIVVVLRAPRHNGAYLLELDMVQEHVGWFSEAGSPPLRIPCRITGGLEPPANRERPPVTAPAERPFRERHPRLFAALSAVRLRDLYWRWRRALDRGRSRRDDLIRHYVHPLILWWNERPFVRRFAARSGLAHAPEMAMHCVPRADVLALVEQCGARVVDVEEELMSGHYYSARYWVVKSTAAEGGGAPS